jgi:hypothetical protein
MSMVGKDGRETAKNGGIDDDNLFEELEGCRSLTPGSPRQIKFAYTGGAPTKEHHLTLALRCATR